MKKKIKKIMNKTFNKTWKKSLIIFLVIFSIIFVGGLTSINHLNDVVTNNHICPEIVTVHDKGYGEKLFSSIEIGRTYKFIVREPELTDINQNTHILQVHNVTNSNT